MLLDVERPVLDPIAERNDASIQMPFLFDAAILSRIRSLVTSLRSGRRMEHVQAECPCFVVLNAWVTETKDT